MHVGELRQTRRPHYESYSSKGARGRVVDTGPGSDTWPGQRRGRDYSRWLSLSHALLEAFHYLNASERKLMTSSASTYHIVGGRSALLVLWWLMVVRSQTHGFQLGVSHNISIGLLL